MKFFLLITLSCVFCFAASSRDSLIEDLMFDNTMTRLEGAITETVRRQTIFAHNLANKDVEGYKPIRFAEELKELKQRPGFDPKNDKVVVEEEMAKMTKNKFKHQALLRLYNMKVETVKKVISQGKG